MNRTPPDDLTPHDVYQIKVGLRCRCGNAKRKNSLHCYRCYQYLPPSLRNGLFRSFANGLRANYIASLKHLERGKYAKKTNDDAAD